MAKVKDALGCREVRGKIGGMVYRISGGGQIVQAKSYGRMGTGLDQSDVRAAFQELIREFQDLPRALQDEWRKFVQAGKHLPPGQGVCPCASSKFVEINMTRKRKGMETIKEPPKVGQPCRYAPKETIWQEGRKMYTKVEPAPGPGQIWQFRFWLRQPQFPPRGYNKPYWKDCRTIWDPPAQNYYTYKESVQPSGRWISRYRGMDEVGGRTPWNAVQFDVSPVP